MGLDMYLKRELKFLRKKEVKSSKDMMNLERLMI